MKKPIEIKLLADCKEHIPALAELWLAEIGKPWIPGATVERAVETYQTHLKRDHLPLTFVAIKNDQPIGMASLRENDGIRDDLTPWLGSVIVHPNYRSQRVGETLIEKVKQQARAFKFSKLYLFALDKTIPTWYEKLGWKIIGTDQFKQHLVTVMSIDL